MSTFLVTICDVCQCKFDSEAELIGLLIVNKKRKSSMHICSKCIPGFKLSSILAEIAQDIQRIEWSDK